MTDEEFEILKKEHTKLLRVHMATEKKYRKVLDEIVAEVRRRQETTTYTDAELLDVYTYVGDIRVENNHTYDLLNNHPDFVNTGLAKGIGYSPITDQSSLRIALNHDADQDMLDRTAAVIEKWVEYIKPGASGNYNYGRKVKPTERDLWRTFSVSTHDMNQSGVVTLSLTDSGSWILGIITYSRWSYEKPRSLMDALKHIRDHFPLTRALGEEDYSDE